MNRLLKRLEVIAGEDESHLVGCHPEEDGLQLALCLNYSFVI
jgi:hypothetical protein